MNANMPSSRRASWAPLLDWAGRRRGALIAAASFALLSMALLALSRLAGETSYDAVVAAFLATPPLRVAAAVLLTSVSFATLSFCDLTALAAVGAPRAWRSVAAGAMSAGAISQTVGLGALSGAAVRLRFYTPLGVAPADIARVVALVMASYGCGVAGAGALGALVSPAAAAKLTGASPALTLGAAAAVLGALVALCMAGGARVRAGRLGGVSAALPPRGAILRLIALGVLDALCAAGVIWLAFPVGAISYAALLPVFACALAIGLISHVPAGVGVFEAAMLAGLSGAVPAAETLSAIVLFRLVYQVLPLAVASIGLAMLEGRKLLASPVARAAAGLAPQALSAMAVVLGAMLVLSGVTPSAAEDVAWLGRWLPLPLLESAHFLASVLGALLLVAARGLAFRLDAAWTAALVAALFAAACSVVKAVAIYEAAALVVFAASLFAARRAFDRRSRLFDAALGPSWAAAVGAVMLSAAALLLFVYGHAEFGATTWLRFEIGAEAPRGLRAVMGAALVLGLAGLWTLLRPARAEDRDATAGELAEALAIARAQDDAAAMMVAMGDKRLMFSEDRRAFAMYGRRGSTWLALYDPVGPREVWPELIWRFIETARASGGNAAFYEVSPDNLSLYADAGLRFLKMGEQARVDLAAFDLRGGRRAAHRTVLNRGARDGLTVALVPEGGAAALTADLRRISDEWLVAQGGREKGFSVAAFDEALLERQRVAILRAGDRIVAFVSLFDTAARMEASAGLMRHGRECPANAMEFLFLRLCGLLRDEGVAWLDLGMAPLAGLADREAAPLWQRLGAALYEHGARAYSFKGLRAFKAGLKPEWRPRYLAFARGANPAIVLIDASRLIGRGHQQDRP